MNNNAATPSKRSVGENQLQRTLRLFREFSRTVMTNPENENLDLRFNDANEGGQIVFIDIDNHEEVLFDFRMLKDLDEYLTTSWLDRILMSRGAGQ